MEKQQQKFINDLNASNFQIAFAFKKKIYLNETVTHRITNSIKKDNLGLLIKKTS